MKPGEVAIVGAAETTELGVIPGMSQIQLHADCALNAMRDAGLELSDIDGIACAGEVPTNGAPATPPPPATTAQSATVSTTLSNLVFTILTLIGR